MQEDNDLPLSLTSPFWDNLRKKNEKLGDLAARRRFSDKIESLKTQYTEIWQDPLEPPRDADELTDYFDEILHKMPASIDKFGKILNEVNNDVNDFMAHFSNDKVLLTQLKISMIDIHKLPDRIRGRHNILLNDVVSSRKSINNFFLLLKLCRGRAEKFRNSMIILGRNPTFVNLVNAMTWGDKYRQKIVTLYSRRYTEDLPHSAVFKKLKDSCLRGMDSEDLLAPFTRYNVAYTQGWTDTIDRMRTALQAAGGNTSDAHIIRVLTHTAVRNVSLVSTFILCVQELGQEVSYVLGIRSPVR